MGERRMEPGGRVGKMSEEERIAPGMIFVHMARRNTQPTLILRVDWDGTHGMLWMFQDGRIKSYATHEHNTTREWLYAWRWLQGHRRML